MINVRRKFCFWKGGTEAYQLVPGIDKGEGRFNDKLSEIDTFKQVRDNLSFLFFF